MSTFFDYEAQNALKSSTETMQTLFSPGDDGFSPVEDSKQAVFLPQLQSLSWQRAKQTQRHKKHKECLVPPACWASSLSPDSFIHPLPHDCSLIKDAALPMQMEMAERNVCIYPGLCDLTTVKLILKV